jgi:hypothetical protein
MRVVRSRPHCPFITGRARTCSAVRATRPVQRIGMSRLTRSLRVAALVLASLPLTRLAAQPPATAPARPPANSATLDGVVRDDAGNPLAGAVISATSLARMVISDKAGHFSLDGLPSDSITVGVRRIGYQSTYFALAIPPQTTVSIAVKLVPNATELGAVVVDAERSELSLVKGGFYERKRVGVGYFLGPDRIIGRENSRFTSLLRDVPQLQIQCAAGLGRCYPYFLLSGGGEPSCVPDLWVDGRPQLGDNFDDMVDLGEVKGVEVYRRKQDVPPGYSRTRTCAAILVWTSRYR